MCRLFSVVVPNYRHLRSGRPGLARGLPELAVFLLARPGLLRRMLPHLLAFFRPGFHPWSIADAPLAEAALAA